MFRFSNILHAILVTEWIRCNECSEHGRQFKIELQMHSIITVISSFLTKFIFFKQHLQSYSA